MRGWLDRVDEKCVVIRLRWSGRRVGVVRGRVGRDARDGSTSGRTATSGTDGGRGGGESGGVADEVGVKTSGVLGKGRLSAKAERREERGGGRRKEGIRTGQLAIRVAKVQNEEWAACTHVFMHSGTRHWYGLLPVWILRWRAREDESEKLLPHSGSEQMWGRSPVLEGRKGKWWRRHRGWEMKRQGMMMDKGIFERSERGKPAPVSPGSSRFLLPRTCKKMKWTYWTRIWTVRADRWMKDLPQPSCSHVNGLPGRRQEQKKIL
jgi:hypothetical protein